ncbi:MAG TPA: ATP-binding cassette domain-containing protein [Puia sp.]|nr:ATP-binding cassette domain-containing protein [Puia sp.]
MRITLIDAGKRFNREWIFRHLHYEFTGTHSYAITGPNGSGKSTLLQAIAGAIGISEGKISYGSPTPGSPTVLTPSTSAGRSVPGSTLAPVPAISGSTALAPAIPDDQIFRYISLAAPYLELIEEMTVTEFLGFHQQFKPFLPAADIKSIISRLGLHSASHKQIRYYSSGMKQRVRLAQAIFSDTPVVLLDEPCTNLDAEGIALYRQLVAEYCSGRLLIVSSNDVQEYDFCEERLSITDWK